jgi:hypothetical protein
LDSHVSLYSNLTGNSDVPRDTPLAFDGDETSNAVEARAEVRHRVRIRVALLLNGRNHELTTENVSLRGVFLRSNDPVPPRQLVRLRLVLPPHDEVLVVPAMVVRSVEPSTVAEGEAGFGVRFVGLDGEPKELWLRFLRYVDGLTEKGKLYGDEVLSKPVDPELTPYRPLVDLAISVGSLDELEALIANEVSRGRVLIPIDVPVPSANPVRVHLIHPHIREAFILDGTVIRWTRDHERGVATVDLVRLTHGMRRALKEFVTGPLHSCVVSEVEVVDSQQSSDLSETREAPFFTDEMIEEMHEQSESKTKLIPAHRLAELCDGLLSEEAMFEPSDDDTTPHS